MADVGEEEDIVTRLIPDVPKWWCFRICGESPRGCGMVFDELFCWNMNRRSFDGDVFVAWWFPSFLSFLSYLGDPFFFRFSRQDTDFCSKFGRIFKEPRRTYMSHPPSSNLLLLKMFYGFQPMGFISRFHLGEYVWFTFSKDLQQIYYKNSIYIRGFLDMPVKLCSTPWRAKPLSSEKYSAFLAESRIEALKTTEGWAFRKVSKLGAELILEGTGVRKPEIFRVVATQIFFIFTPDPWGNDPFWLIFFKWVETTNWFCLGKGTMGAFFSCRETKKRKQKWMKWFGTGRNLPEKICVVCKFVWAVGQ